MLAPKEIILGLTASIAIYKSCDIARKLTKAGIRVQAAMTPNASKWITPHLFTALTGIPALTDISENGMAHIDIRKNKSLFLIAPASANTIMQAANGGCDNIVTSTLLSYNGPRWIAPAMNPFMYSHPATQKNLNILRDYGYQIIDPMDGDAVCGDNGLGKMATVENITNSVINFLK